MSAASLLAPAPPTDRDAGLRAGVEEICDHLCDIATGDFSARVRTTCEDETAQKLVLLANFALGAADRALAEARERADDLRDASLIARIGTWRRDLVQDSMTVSEELRALLGFPPGTPAPSTGELEATVLPEDRPVIAAACAEALGGRTVETEWRARRSDGTVLHLWVELRAETDGTGRVVALRGVCQDVTERRAAQQRIYDLAHRDSLTGLANRVLLGERLGEAMAGARGTGRSVAVLCLDLDGFKAVNDLNGHAAGDALLRMVAERLTLNVRETDTVGRHGGDEFIIVQDGLPQPDGARALADRIVGVLAEPYHLPGGVTASVTASVGIAIFPRDAADTAALLHHADTALYRAKGAGRNGAAFFSPGMDAEVRERCALERDLREALPRGEFALAWQPLADQRGVTGFEVLLRWQHPERGPVPPDRFIPAAEASGVIIPIGAWVLREACREAAGWATPLHVAVNVSPVQAAGGEAFATMVEEALAATGLAPSRLVLEVTEGVLIRDPDRVVAALRRLKAIGVSVAMDDFGTGYSSLATLRAFPFDKIKIDRGFVAGLPGNGQDAAIVRAVIGLAHGLGLPVVAEGVETEAQREALWRDGCQELQGWLIGRPAPIATFAAVTAGGNRVNPRGGEGR